MRRGRAEWIEPGEALLDRDAGQLGDGDLDARHLVPAQIGADHDRHEAMLAPDVAQHPAAVGIAELDQRGERVERRCDVAGLLGDDDEPIVLVIVGERHAEAVEDAPARRRQQPQIDAVLVGQHRVAVRLEDLELVHAPGKDGDERRLAAGENGRSPGEELLALRFPLHRRCG